MGALEASHAEGAASADEAHSESAIEREIAGIKSKLKPVSTVESRTPIVEAKIDPRKNYYVFYYLERNLVEKRLIKKTVNGIDALTLQDRARSGKLDGEGFKIVNFSFEQRED